jgi:integrase
MAAIISRARADGSTGYTARVRLREGQVVIHQETKTFSSKTAAKDWAKRREVELETPGVLAKAQQGDTSLASIIRWYIDSFETISNWQRSKHSALEFLKKHPIGQVDVLKLTTERIVDHIRNRRESGICGATAANDLIWIGLVLEAAQAARSLSVDIAAIDRARVICSKLRLISRSTRRERRPTNDELSRLDEYFHRRDRHRCSVIPMRTVMWFAVESTRREAEISRLERSDNDEIARTGLVRDAKHPRAKDGNHLRFRYTQKAWEIAQYQPETGTYIFPYDPKCISSAFTEACQFLGIDDLRFHDLRHEAVSRLFEEGYDIHDVPLISLHQSWEDLKRYTNLRPETMREIVTLEDGERVTRITPTTRRTLASPPANELIPPMTRRSRSRIFTLSD